MELNEWTKIFLELTFKLITFAQSSVEEHVCWLFEH